MLQKIEIMLQNHQHYCIMSATLFISHERMTPRQQQLLDYIQKHQQVKSATLQKIFGTERTVLYRDLQKLIAEGKITSPSK